MHVHVAAKVCLRTHTLTPLICSKPTLSMASSWVPTLTSQYSLDRVDVSWSVFPKITKLLVDILLNLKARKPYPPGLTCQNFLGSLKNNIIVVGTLHGINHQSLHLQRLAPLMWSLIKITLKPQVEEAKTPDHSKINQKKPSVSLTCLYVNSVSYTHLTLPTKA